jgi:HlyD family secretion protein
VRDLKQQALSVVAPAAGKVIKLRQQSEAVVAAGMALLEMGDPAALEVVVELLSEDAAQIKPGMRATLSNWGGTSDLQARVRLIEPAAFTKISALGVEEQRVNVILDLTSPPEQWATLGDNFKADVSIAVQSAEQVTLVPVGALFPQGSRSALFVLDAGRARLHEVELVARNGSVAWIKTTLKPGTQVINYPPSVLLDGTRVTATTASVARNE